MQFMLYESERSGSWRPATQRSLPTSRPAWWPSSWAGWSWSWPAGWSRAPATGWWPASWAGLRRPRRRAPAGAVGGVGGGGAASAGGPLGAGPRPGVIPRHDDAMQAARDWCGRRGVLKRHTGASPFPGVGEYWSRFRLTTTQRVLGSRVHASSVGSTAAPIVGAEPEGKMTARVMAVSPPA